MKRALLKPDVTTIGWIATVLLISSILFYWEYTYTGDLDFLTVTSGLLILILMLTITVSKALDMIPFRSWPKHKKYSHWFGITLLVLSTVLWALSLIVII